MIRQTEIWFEGLDGVAAEVLKNSVLTGYQIGVKEGVDLSGIDVMFIEEFETDDLKEQLISNIRAMSPYSKITF